MEKAQRTKPTFEVLHGTISVKVNGRVYNVRAVGPSTWHGLRNANYGFGFKEGTLGENLNLLYSAYLNQETSESKGVIGVQRLWVTGNTAMYGGDGELIFAQDMPEVKEGRIFMLQKDLEARLGKREVKGVIFSDDGLVRAMPRANVREGEYNAEQMLRATFPIFMTGDENASEKMADMMQACSKPGYFWVPAPKAIRVPGLDEASDRLGLDGGWLEFGGVRYSFGVS